MKEKPISSAKADQTQPCSDSHSSPWSMRTQIAFLFPKLSKEQEKKALEKGLKDLEQEQPQNEQPKK